MREPKLSDFDLDEQDIERYKKMIERRVNLEKLNSQEKAKTDEYNNNVTAEYRNKWGTISGVCFLIGIISFFGSFLSCGGVAGAYSCEESEAMAPLLIFVFSFLICLVVGIRVSKNEQNSSPNKMEYKPKYSVENIVDESLQKRIFAYQNAVNEYQTYLRLQKRNYWLNMSGFEFEKAVASLYGKLGYSAIVTKSTGDGGVDIILKKDNKKIAVQCKHHLSPVGPNDFRALIGTIVTQGFDSGIFVSLNGFTTGVINEKRASHIYVELVDINTLIAYSRNLAEEKFAYTNNKTEQKIATKNKKINNDYKKYIGAIVRYDRYGTGYIKEISGDKVRIKFSNRGGEPFEKDFLVTALNKTIEIIKLDNV